MAIVRNLMVRAVADFSGLESGMNQALGRISSFGSRAENIFKRIGEVGRGIKDVFEVFAGVGEAVSELANRAAELDGGMSSLNRTLGQSAVSYMDWANGTATSYGIAKMSAVEYGKSIAMLLADVYKNQNQLAAQTEKLMQGGAIIAAKTGKSQQEVYDDLNSALMGHSAAVKSLDINVMENALVHSAAYKQIANGAPWVKLSAEQQQYIRVTELNRQIQKKFGDTIGDGMDARMLLFKASLDNVKTALSEAFMPILFKVLPLLTAFINAISTALNYVGAFFKQLFGYQGIQPGQGVKSQTQTVSALGGAYENASQSTNKQTKAVNAQTSGVNKLTKALHGAKQALTSLAGIDEINTIKQANAAMDGSGGSGVGGVPTAGGDGSSIPVITPPDSGGYQAALDAINAAVKDFVSKFESWIAPLKPYWDDLVTACGNLGTAIGNLVQSSGFQTFLGWLATAVQFAVGNLIEQIANSIQTLADEIQTIADLLNGDFGKAWSDFQKVSQDLYNLFGPLAPLVAGVAAGFVTMKVIETITGMMAAFEIAIIALNAALVGTAEAEAATGIGAIPVIVGLAVAALVALAANWDTVTASVKSFGTWLYSNAIQPLGTFIQTLSDDFKDLGKKLWGWITTGFGDVKSWFTTNVADKATAAFSNFGSNVYTAFTSGWGSVYTWIKTNVTDKIVLAVTNMGSLGYKIWTSFRGGWGSVYYWIKDNVVSKITSAINTIGSIGAQIWSSLKTGWSNVGGWFTTNIANPIKKAFSGITSGLGGSITNGFKAVYNTAAGFINNMIGSLDRMISKLQDINVFGSHPFGGLPMVSSIPLLAKGGIINSPTLAMVGEAGREAVMPLENNTGWINELASKINSLNGGNTGNSGPTEVILQLNETTLGKAVIGAINKVHRRGGKVLLNV